MNKRLLLSLTIILSTVSIAQNNSLHFDGVDDSVDLQQNFSFEATDSFTIEAWIYIDKLGSFQQIISKLGSGNQSFRGWGFQVTNDAHISGFVSTEFFTQTRFVEGDQILNTDTWYHVAMTFDGQDEVLLFVNGERETFSFVDNDGALTTIANSSPTRIGSFDDGTAQEHFQGNIDDLRIWNVVRTEEEIANNYLTELSGNENNLLAYYKMDVENSTCDIQDCNTNEAHGTRIGESGINNLPQFSTNAPSIQDVECEVELNCTLSIDDETYFDFSIFPSPTNDVLTFSRLDLNGKSVKLYNVLGGLSKEIIIDNNSISISELQPGIYFMVISIGRTTVSKKIIKK